MKILLNATVLIFVVFLFSFILPKACYIDKNGLTIFMMHLSKKDLELLSFIGSFGSFVVGLMVAIYACMQYLNSKREGRRTLAYQIHSEFLKLSFDNPQYANPVESILDFNDLENLKYKYFVANMLFSFEQIYSCTRGELDWLNVMRHQIIRHKKYLEKSGALKKKHWSENFQKFVESTIKNS